MPTLRSHSARFALATLLICACVAPLAKANAQTSGGGFRIAGKVVSSVSSAPLAQARVTIASVRDQRDTKSVITSNDGTFALTNLPAGKYSMSSARRGFIESQFDQHERYSTAIVTGGDADSEHLVFRLTPQAILSGHVFDETGEPVRRASVSLYRQDQSSGVGRIRRTNSVRTDDLGTYEFAELAAGTYFLSASGKPWYAIHAHSIQKPDGSLEAPQLPPAFDVTYATTYYPDTNDSDDASPIPLRGGERLSVDMRLSPVPALRIVVRAPEGPSQGQIPQLLKKSFDSMENVTAEVIDRGSDSTGDLRPGSFNMVGPNTVELSGLAAGKYTVFVPGSGALPSEGALAEINLNHNGQELTPSSGEPVSSLKFAVKILGESRIPERLALALENGDHKVIVASGVEPDGQSEFVRIPPGKYNLLAATPGNNYQVIQIVSNGSAAKGHSLEIGAGSTIEGTVTLIGGRTIVEGIAKREGKGVAGVMIALVPKDPDADRELFRRDQSDLDGTFSLGNVIPGEYTIVAIDNGWDLNWLQPGVIAQYLPHGQKIAIAPTAQEPVRLREPVEVQPR